MTDVLVAIERAEKTLRDLKRSISVTGDNEARVAGLLRDAATDVIEEMTSLVQQSTNLAFDVRDDLVSSLENHQDEHFWGQFQEKLTKLEGSCEIFRGECLFSQLGEEYGFSTVLHEMCKVNPPANAVRAVIGLAPESLGYDAGVRAVCYGENDMGPGEYPLHMVMKYGGSLELVKLLLEADAGPAVKKTLHTEIEQGESEQNVFHTLVLSKSRHQPQVFSQILRHLVLSISLSRISPLVVKAYGDPRTPVGMLFHALKGEGLSNTEILLDADFSFLLKAVCYYWGEDPFRRIGREERLKEIEMIPLCHALLVASPCLKKVDTVEVLEDISTADSAFWTTKHENWDYPIHCIISRNHYFMQQAFNDPEYWWFMLEAILKACPETAQQPNEDGLLPLHIVSDFFRLGEMMDDVDRLPIVQAVWKAFPDATKQTDKEFVLPAFALPVRGKDDDWKGQNGGYLGISSSFFLLRQSPDIVATFLSKSTEDGKAKPAAQKRQRQQAKKESGKSRKC